MNSIRNLFFNGPCAAILNIKNLQKTVGFPENQILTYEQQFCVDFYSVLIQPMREIDHSTVKSISDRKVLGFYKDFQNITVVLYRVQLKLSSCL